MIGTVVGDPTVVVRDIQNPANAKNLCRFDAAALLAQFVTGSIVAYEDSSGHIVQTDLSSGATSIVASYGSSSDYIQYAVSPDGQSLTYFDGNGWHLVKGLSNKTLTTLPPVPGRGINPTEDDRYLAFSPDGNYVALFQTFNVGGSGETAPDQIRRVDDGSLIYSTSDMTMAVWASVPSRLFFRDTNGNVYRWDPSAGLSSMTSLHWIRPTSSPDGRWIAYTYRTTSGLDEIGFYSVQSNAQQFTTPAGRATVAFLTNDLVWYIGEKALAPVSGQAVPTGVTYMYSIASRSETTSRLASVADAWPRATSPGR